MNKKLTFCLILTFLLSAITTADTLYVSNPPTPPSWYPTIQAAINAANPGDEVVVANGTYSGIGNRDLDFNGIDITVRSASVNPATCIIDCNGLGRAFYFHNDETPASVVQGFTIKNGDAYYGGAIECEIDSSPTIDNCIIINNAAAYGGAIDCFYASPVIINCIITSNTSDYDGSAIECSSESSPIIYNCLILNNTSGGSGAIDCFDGSLPAITNCTIIDNRGDANLGGVHATDVSISTIRGSILWNNGDDIYGATDVNFSCIQDGDAETGNISSNPMFRKGSYPSYGNYYLSQTAAGQLADSNCVNAGGDTADAVFGTGHPFTTRTDNVPDSNTVDMGFHYPDSGIDVNYVLITGVDPNGNYGTIDPNWPTGHLYKQFAEVSIDANPDLNCRVEKWRIDSNDVNDANTTRIVTMDANHTVTVKFSSIIICELTTFVIDGNGTIDLYNAQPFVKHSVVDINAYPNPGYVIKRWLKGDTDTFDIDNASTYTESNDPNTTYTVTLLTNTTVAVEFKTNPITHLLTPSVIGGHGAIDPNRRTYYPGGTIVQLRATPDSGYLIKTWGGNVPAGDGNTRTVTMNSDKTVTVEFEAIPQYQLTVNINDPNLGSVEPNGGWYDANTVVTLTAHPAEGYRVKSWAGTNTTPAWNVNTNTVTMNANKTVTVTFELDFNRVIHVFGDVNGIQNAINQAQNGDTIQIHPGTYTGTGFTINKIITIVGDPEHPENVIIDCSGQNRYYGCTPIRSTGFDLYGGSILNGVTIINSHTYSPTCVWVSPQPGQTPPPTSSNYMGAIIIYGNSNIKNCIIRDCSVEVERALDGYGGGDPNRGQNQNSGNGGDSGSAGGAGIYVSYGDPNIINVLIENCTAIGGDAGDGNVGFFNPDPCAPYYPPGTNGSGGRGGSVLGTGIHIAAGSPKLTNVTVRNCTATAGGGGNGSNPIPLGVIPNNGGNGGLPGSVEGVGIYCAGGASPVLVNCIVENCIGYSGKGGNGGNGGLSDYNDTLGGYGGLTTDPCAGQGDIRTYTTKGGAVSCGSSSAARFTNCSFTGNSIYGSISGLGGMSHLYGANVQREPRKNYRLAGLGAGAFCSTNSSATFNGCHFEDNRTIYNQGLNEPNITYYAGEYTGSGGGLCLWYTHSADINDCNFILNSAPLGGGIYSIGLQEEMHIRNCNIKNNTSLAGGGILALDSVGTISKSIIKGNSAGSQTGYYQDIGYALFGTGGGIYALNTLMDINDTLITGNYARLTGGGICFDGDTPFIPRPLIKNCLVANNTAAEEGGGIAAIYFAQPKIQNCTITENTVTDVNSNGGGLFASYAAEAIVKDSILWANGGIYGSQIALTNGGPFTNMPAELTITYSDIDLLTGTVPIYPETGCTIIGLEQDANDKWVVSSGSHNLAEDPLFVSGYYLSHIATGQDTDSNCIDAGSTTAAALGLNTYTTRTDGVFDSNTVDLGYHYRSAATQQPGRIIHVPGSYPYIGIQEAIDIAQDGDTVMIHSGNYIGTGFEVVGKNITITGTNPDDPATVAQTIIDGTGETSGGIYLVGAGSGSCVLSGLTIANMQASVIPGLDADDPGESGGDGGWVYGESLVVAGNHKILNCIIRDCYGRGGDGGNGANGGTPPTNPSQGGDGGDGGGVGGLGILVVSGSPVIKNCTIENCTAIGGDGGDAGDGLGGNPPDTIGGPGGRGGLAGRAFGAGIACLAGSNPTFKNCIVRNCQATGGHGGNGGDSGFAAGAGGYGGLCEEDPLRDSPTNYSAYGGGVYLDQGCYAAFVNCTIVTNTTEGSISGLGGLSYYEVMQFPHRNFNIPSYGAGIFCAENSYTRFGSCNIQNNETTSHGNYYVGYGGGFVIAGGTHSELTDCNISDNRSTVGGGLYGINVQDLLIDNSDVLNNLSYVGGGVFTIYSKAQISNCNINQNSAEWYPAGDMNDPNNAMGEASVYGSGGGIYSFATQADIENCQIIGNLCSGSGGGIYIGGSQADPDYPLIKNCLITNNKSSRDGGGISTNWFATTKIQNCTITENYATNANGHGGGLYSSYASDTLVKDTIFWANSGIDGSQIAVGSGDANNPLPSILNVTYSDIDLRIGVDFNSLEFESGAGSGTTTVLIDEQTIHNEINSTGSAKVIVSLAEPTQMRAITNWSSPASVDALQTEIATRQNQALSTLSAGEFTLRHKLVNVAAFSGRITQAGLDKLLSNSLVAHIEPVRTVYLMTAQGIPLMNAYDTRGVFNGSGVSVAIVDTGVDYTHPRLGGGGFPNSKVIGGYDTGNNDADPMPVGVAHGTCCAGITAGSLGTVGDYIGGVAYNAKIYALKASPDNAGYLYSDDTLAAWDWCITHRNDNPANPIKAISNSWGGGGPINDSAVADAYSPAHTTAAQTAVDAGITILAASGNDGFAGEGISWPAAMSNVISVGAVYDAAFVSQACGVPTQPDQVTCYSNTADILDILAPSENAYTTDIVGTAGYSTGDYFPYFNGTSAACPYAAGVVAALQNAVEQIRGIYLTPAQVRGVLKITGDPVTDTKVAITKPRVNLGAAIALLTGSVPIYVETGCTIIGLKQDANDTWVIDDNNNISEDPNFVFGYYLSHIATGQDIDSNCIDAGSATAAAIGLDTYTTRIDGIFDGIFDSNIVDLGYHYRFAVPQYDIIVKILTDANYPGIHGHITADPNKLVSNDANTYKYRFYAGMIPALTAVPDTNYYVKGWYDEEDMRISISNIFNFTVDANATYFVRFKPKRTIPVSGGGTALRNAINTAENGDTLTVAAGTYSGGINIGGKQIKIYGVNPDDPNVVARTIIDCSGNSGLVFAGGEDNNTVIDGFTIINGGDAGGAISINTNSSPLIVNVDISNCNALNASGGAIYISDGSNPEFRNVNITNCSATMNGGGIYISASSSPIFKGCSIADCDAGVNGGAVYCDAESRPEFTGCSFSGNNALVSGGAIFYGADCNVTLISCDFAGNTANDSAGAVMCSTNCVVEVNDCNFGGNQADYAGAIYLDAACDGRIHNTTITANVATEDGGAIYITDSNVIEITDCNLTENTALRGGGIFALASPKVTITNCQINSNLAYRLIIDTYYTDPNDPNTEVTVYNDDFIGEGGAIYAFAGIEKITNCRIMNNMTRTSGGGIYIGGELPDPNYPLIKNCLIANNKSGRDGGGISTNWFATTKIKNCTITQNIATGNGYQRALGGGIYGSYGSDTQIIDSIIWSNVGTNASQIALGSGDANNPIPSIMNVTYSDIGHPNEVSHAITTGETIRAGFDTYTLARNDDESTGLVDFGFTINFFGQFRSQCYVNNNGNITFNTPMWTFTPFGLTTNIGTSIIAPFFADVDTRAAGSNLVTYGRGTVNGRPAFGVNWIDVGYFGNHADKLNSFQLIIIDRSDRALYDFDMEFNYKKIQWETGDASGGRNGFGGYSARAGYSNGTGRAGSFYEIQGSGTNGAFLDSNPNGLIYREYHSGLEGSFSFRVEGGQPEMPYIGSGLPLVYVEPGCTLNWNPSSGWAPDSNNIEDDPNFVFGHYLSHVSAGQDFNSPCIDIGSNTAAALGLNTFTTRADGVNDVNTVDLGYHYSGGVRHYELRIDVNGPPLGTIESPWTPGNTYQVYENTMVKLHAIPDVNSRVVMWIIDGVVYETHNRNFTFTMDRDKHVTVKFEFYAPKNLIVPDEYTNIQNAIDAAENGDTVYIYRKSNGQPYHITDPCGLDFKGKAITIRSENPQDPNIVATTVIDCNQAGRAFIFQNGEDSNSIIEGLTITNCLTAGDIAQGIQPDPYDTNDIWNGIDATGDGYGGAVFIGRNASPTIRYCVFSNCEVTGGIGSDGRDGFSLLPDDPNARGGRGGNGGSGFGSGYGGAIFCDQNSSPMILNCTIGNCAARGGIGGNGGNGGTGTTSKIGGNGGNGGNGSGLGYGGAIYASTGANPKIIGCNLFENTASQGLGGAGGSQGAGQIPTQPPYAYPGFDGALIGAGFAGVIYYEKGAKVDINDCNFIGNTAEADTSDIYDTGGGAIYCEPNCTSIKILKANIAGNRTTQGNGGAIWFGANNDVNLTDCYFGGNTATNINGNGGALTIGTENDQNICNLDFTNCAFTDNIAGNMGGAIIARNFDATFVDCYINRNTAASGGGLYLISEKSTAKIHGGTIMHNRATGANAEGGGAFISNLPLEIINCQIISNTSLFSGGGIMFKGPHTATSRIHNCLLAKNSAGARGGAVLISLNSWPQITSCTFSENGTEPGGAGGAVFCAYNSSPIIKDCIFDQTKRIAIYESSTDSDPNISYCLFYDNADGDFYDRDSGITYNSREVNNPDVNFAAFQNATSLTNKEGEPTFIESDLGKYYLSQIPPNGKQSPAINEGSAPAVDVNVLADDNMADYTTRTDSNTVDAGDAGQLDIGFHYIDIEPNWPRQFELTTTVIGGHGNIEPLSGRYYAGTTIELTALPQPGWRVNRWTGTDDDSTTNTTNYVVMIRNRSVTVSFEQPRNLYVPGEYTALQYAVNDAKSGDKIIIAKGVYYGNETNLDYGKVYIQGKNITITGTNPDDPCVVAQTIFQGNGFYILNVDSTMILDGITIQDAHFYAGDVECGEDWAHGPTGDGYNGYSISGGGINLYNASPIIRNCRFVNCSVLASNACNGEGDYGDGGWAGYAWGGAVGIDSTSNPVFKNCQFIDCYVQSSNGGDGAGEWGHGGNWGDPNDNMWHNWDFGPYEEYWYYSGYGGAIYCMSGSKSQFENCLFQGNRAYGGVCGISGTALIGGYPNVHYAIDTFGGAVYMAAGSDANFIDCTFIDNEADTRNQVGPNDANYTDDYVLNDPVIGYGGGICAEGTATIPVLKNCIFINNRACAGGGIYWEDSIAHISSCTFEDNISMLGGAMLLTDSNSIIFECDFSGNEAINPAGEGGAIYCASSDAKFYDCEISNNEASTSGGGAYFSGELEPNMHNCLITHNSAGRDGGGISANWDSQLTLSNCTIANNAVTGDGFASGYGGGLSCAYEADTKVVNGIIWNNNAEYGPEISIGSSFDAANKLRAEVTVSYSDVEDGAAGVFVDTEHGCILNWDDANSHNINSDPNFILGYYLSLVEAGQDYNSPCFDKGLGTAESLGLNTYTTRTDGVFDANIVDLGYHYRFATPQYDITVTILQDANYPGIHGTITADPNKLISYDANTATYKFRFYAGTTPNLTAVPNANYYIRGWYDKTDTMISNTESITFTVDSNDTYFVRFATPQYDITVTILQDANYPGIHGTITADPNKLISYDANTATYKYRFYTGLSPVLTAVPDANYYIRGWYDKTDTMISNTESITFTVDSNDTYFVRFRSTLQYDITVTILQDANYPGIHGTIITADPNKLISYDANTTTYKYRFYTGLSPVLTAVPDANYYIRGWYDQNNTRISVYNTFSFTVVANDTYFVRFKPKRIIILSGGGLTLRNAVNTAENGDTLIVAAGTYSGGINIGGKQIKLYGTNPDDPNVVNRTIIDCAGTGQGFVFAGGETNNTTIDGFRIVNGGGNTVQGGAIFIDINSSPIIANVDIRDCNVLNADGGAIYIGSESSPEFRNVDITNCSATINGGGVYISGNSSPVFNGCSIADCYAGINGGGAYCDTESSPTFTDCRFTSNTAAGSAGAIFYGEFCTGNLDDCDFAENTASNFAGAVMCGTACIVEVSNCNFIRNSAPIGGAMSLINSNSIIFECDFNGNQAIDPAGQGGAIYCASSAAKFYDCEISNNEANSSGGGAYFSGELEPNMHNCLIWHNSAGRDGGGISANWDAQLTLSNCTIAHNTITGNGFASGFGGGLSCAYEANTKVINGIIWSNNAEYGPEISIGSNFDAANKLRAEVTVSYSDVEDGAAGVFVDTEHGCILNWDDTNNLTGTTLESPLFVTGYWGDYYLSQPTDQNTTSLCVDRGFGLAIDNDMYRHTTRTDHVTVKGQAIDSGIVDMGYHYMLTAEILGDFNFDGIVDINDLGLFELYWMNSGCVFPYFCHERDITEDGEVDFEDFAAFAANYGEIETIPPKPDPMTWAARPRSADVNKITMTATTARDNSGSLIKYYFDCVSGSCHDRNWDTNSTYIDTDLTTGSQYGYRVKAKDERGNETGWSVIGYAVAGQDDTPPEPNQMTWAAVPYPTSSYSIRMVAVSANDISGVEYYFIETSGNPGANNSNWQSDTAYEDFGLEPNTTYTYRVKARDKSPSHNETQYSTPPASATTPSEPNIDVEPPTPNPSQWASVPQSIQGLDANYPSWWHHRMTAVTATDTTSPPVEYYFDCTEGSGIDSGWITSPTYTAGPFTGVNHAAYRVRTRDSATPTRNVGSYSRTYHTYYGYLD